MSLARYTLIVLTTVLGSLAALWPLLAGIGEAGRAAVLFGGLLAGANTLLAYGLVLWSERRSTQVFLGAVAKLFALEEDVPAGDAAIRTQEVHHRKSNGALPAAGFTYQTQVFAPVNIKRDIPHSVNLALARFVGYSQVFDR